MIRSIALSLLLAAAVPVAGQTGSKPEPMDVPAVQVSEDWPADEIVMKGDMFVPKRVYWTCADKRRVLLTDEGGGKHCILFPQQVPQH